MEQKSSVFLVEEVVHEMKGVQMVVEVSICHLVQFLSFALVPLHQVVVFPRLFFAPMREVSNRLSYEDSSVEMVTYFQ